MAAATLCALGSTAQETAHHFATVSQKNRAFSPRAVSVAQGDTVVFLNDGGGLPHRVHSDDPRFPVDIGEQVAGVPKGVRFTKRGVFEIRCGIHPHMALQVTVR